MIDFRRFEDFLKRKEKISKKMKFRGTDFSLFFVVPSSFEAKRDQIQFWFLQRPNLIFSANPFAIFHKKKRKEKINLDCLRIISIPFGFEVQEHS